MLPGGTADRSQRGLQSDGQRGEAFAAQHHLGKLPAGECQTEVIEPMRQLIAGDGDAEAALIGEVGPALLTRPVLLAKDYVALWAMQRLPTPDAPLQRAAYVWRQVRVTAEQLVEHGDRALVGIGLQHRDDLGVPKCRKRIGESQAAWRLPLRGQPGSASSRAPVLAPIPARAAASWQVWVLRWCMYNLAC